MKLIIKLEIINDFNSGSSNSLYFLSVYSGTAYGDGSYYSKEFNFSFPVDAGIIGIAKYSKCSKLNENPIWAKKAGVIVKKIFYI